MNIPKMRANMRRRLLPRDSRHAVSRRRMRAMLWFAEQQQQQQRGYTTRDAVDKVDWLKEGF